MADTQSGQAGRFLTRISRLASRVALALSATGLSAMVAIICYQVFARYVLNASPSWSEQAALLLMIYFVLFAAAVGIREGFHIRITFLEDRLGETLRRGLRLANHFLVGLFGLAMAAGGAELIEVTSGHTLATLGISRAWAYLPMAAAGVLIFFFSLEHMIAEARGSRVATLWN